MTSDEVEYMERLLAAIEHDDGPLSDWERSFMGDQRKRWETYGERMQLSPKQWAVLFRIGKALDVAEPVGGGK